MYTFESILKTIETALGQLQFTTPPASLYEPVSYILSLGGKRIRPALVLMAYNIYKVEDLTPAIRTALGLEVFHNFTLLHDDLMDKADKRRNKPTVHQVWNDNTAILSGDAMLIEAYRLIGATDPVHLKPILDLFTQTAAEICGGQQYDMEFEQRLDVTEAEYIEMIRLKTAVLLACCLKSGALLADAPAAEAEALYQIGIHIGLAFQLQDDLLDIYGDPATFGKNIGGDILCNKKTIFLVNALKQASEEQRAELLDWMAKQEYDPTAKIAHFTALYNALGLKAQVEAKISDYFDRAMGYFDQLQVAPERLEVLKAICHLLMHRQS